MTAAAGFGLVLALVSSALLNIGLFEQQRSVSASGGATLHQPLAWLRQRFADRRWLTGFVVGCLGWALYVAALALAPLSLVQALSAAGIAVLAVLALRAGELEPSPQNLATVGLAAVGLALLGLSLAGPVGSGSADPAHLAWWVVGSGAAAAAAALSGARRRLVPGAALGVCAGVLYAAGDVVTKAVVSGSPLGLVVVILLAHGLGFVALQVAFREGRPMPTVGTATLLTNALPIAAGLAVFSEPFPSGVLAVARIAGLAASVGAAALLSGGGVRRTIVPACGSPRSMTSTETSRG